MEAIEFIRNANGKNFGWYVKDRSCSDHNIRNFAIQAVNIARNEKPEHINTVQDCELAVRTTKERAIEALDSILDRWVHGGDADYILEEFKNKLEK